MFGRMRILLWDIDGTLVSTGGAGMKALATAVHASEPATQALRRMRLDGMTDRKIARILCAAARHRAEPLTLLPVHESRVTALEIDEMLAAYLGRLRDSLSRADSYAVLPGVLEALDALETKAIHALGTGNLEAGARLKLEHGGLWHRFRFGGYGSDAEERADILRAAWTRAEAHLGRRCTAAEFVVIGDTPKDVAAAHANGLCCVAVATGRHDLHELAQAGADLVLETLAHPDVPQRLLAAVRRP